MAARDFSQYLLYQLRYPIGYVVIGVVLAALLLFAGLYLPGGISEVEMNAVVQSESLSLKDPTTLGIQNLPYYAFQAGVLSVLGISILTIKLPSLIIALFSALGLIVLLRRWFRPNIAVLASLIAVSTGQFLYIAQSGNPSILYLFWPVALLLLGTQVTRVKKFRFLWKILFAATAALSLYTPLMMYPLIAILLAILFHPHLRNVVRRLSKFRLVFVTVLFFLLISPLIWFIILKPQLGLTLLGFPATGVVNISENIMTVFRQYFLFWESSGTRLMTPVFGLGSAILIGLGVYRLFLTRDTTRSYLIIFWIASLMPVLFINPNYTSITFVPAVLILAAGLTSLIDYWYRLFPLNPYARIIGLVPIVILVGALVLTGTTRYIYGYHYNAQVAAFFSNDLSLIPKETTQIVVGDEEKDFYDAVQAYWPTMVASLSPTEDTIVVTRSARDQVGSDYSITKIITSSRSTEADRLYVMQVKQ